MKTDQPVTTKGMSTRDRIVGAARSRLIDAGYDALVVRELADELGIKLGNLQYYFKTREALVLHVMEQEAARDVAMIQAITAETGEARESFRRIVKELVTRWRGKSGVLFSMLATLAVHSKSFNRVYRDNYANFYGALAQPIRQMNPHLPDSEIELRVRLVTALIDGSPMQVQVGGMQAFLERVQEQAEQIGLGA